jgi:hypothetical protein
MRAHRSENKFKPLPGQMQDVLALLLHQANHPNQFKVRFDVRWQHQHHEPIYARVHRCCWHSWSS